jgi:transposase
MTKKTKNKYNHYTEDFRREAVRRSDLPGASAVEVARELGIHPGQIYNWRRQYKMGPNRTPTLVPSPDCSKIDLC